MLYREIMEVETGAGASCTDITERVVATVKKSGIADGLCHVFLAATTAGLMLNENERMLIEDFKRLFRGLAEESRMYSHADNAFSHLRASMLSQEATIPVANSSLVMGKWQSLLLWEFDKEPRKRRIVVTVTG